MTPARSRSRSLQIGLAVAASVAAACGGAAPEAAAPRTEAPAAQAPEAKAPEAPLGDPSTVEQALDQIAAAKAELAGARPGAGAVEKADRYAPEPQSEPSKATAPSAGPARPSTAPRATRPSPADAPAGTSSCGSPCRAIQSMRRAVTALCRMTGTDDTRCVDARRTLSESQARIAPCSC